MKLLLRVAPGIVRKPLIASVILETGALVNIERASIDAVSGEIVLDVSQEKCRQVKDALERLGVDVILLEIPVIRDDSECVHCGACVAICPTGTFHFEDWRVVGEPGRCVQCGACVTACPHRALRLVLK
ncbi:MAG: Ferredoxin [Methanosaeta sp. PtaB.Bin039]|nr:MAG: Ferredoxin [Methanosaeta sp. PtaB.Bin039]HOT07529.1 4Fe-4S binding protein [Methanotrichaceae archaeon]HQF16127.1 4Fe-4S binding protein [Methanotrichaceae archaeon]HQI90759.1 4Fe-4S binding protein [Methanotrichaceae archaeon]HQJ28285.1 4Fe-4S binding protein [Methanotrichaceae archaeon]